MAASIIRCGTLASGQLVRVATERAQYRIDLFDGAAWRPLVSWRGREITAACTCGDAVVCAALDDVAYLIRGTNVEEIALPEQSDWIYAAAALSDDVALLGGAGLFVLSTRDKSVTRRRLSEFNISRPGRDVLSIVRTGGRTIVLGKKNLLVDYRGDSAVELIDRRAVGKELFFEDAAQLGPDLWLAGTSNLQPFLARHAGNTVQFEDVPLSAKGAPALGVLGDELIVGADRLLAGKPGQWRELVPEQTAAMHIVGILPVTKGVPHPICAIASDGTTYFTDGRAVTEIDED